MSDPFLVPKKTAARGGKRRPTEQPHDAPKRLRRAEQPAEQAPQPQENADERRLRQAREYLVHVRDELGDDDAAVGSRLAADASDADGRQFRAIAAAMQPPPAAPAFTRGHAGSVTSVAVSTDGSVAFSGAKDGTIIRWDVERGVRVATFPSFMRHSGTGRAHTAHVLALALTSDGKTLASGGEDRVIHVWDVSGNISAGNLPGGHKDAVTALAFRSGGSRQLFSGAADRCVKVWNADSLAYVETLFGHQASITALDCLDRERVLSAGADGTVRLWKIAEDSQLLYRGGHTGAVDTVALLGENSFVSGGQDGTVALWMASKRGPVDVRRNAHGVGCWISAVAACKRTDLAASASSDGVVQLYRVARDAAAVAEDGAEEAAASTRMPRTPRLVPVQKVGGAVGFANSMAFSASGELLVVGLGQEPRLGRWARNANARNGMLFVRLSYTGDADDD